MFPLALGQQTTVGPRLRTYDLETLTLKKWKKVILTWFAFEFRSFSFLQLSPVEEKPTTVATNCTVMWMKQSVRVWNIFKVLNDFTTQMYDFSSPKIYFAKFW